MKYNNIVTARFISRKNRFVSSVLLDGEEILCHVKNTGRLRELLQKDATVYLEKSNNPDRKTAYDLVAVRKDGKLFNIDSFAPNLAAKAYLEKLFPDSIVKAEVRYGSSRFDFFVEGKDKKAFVEVKGVTLLKDGVALFPDAPTERGVKHMKELISCIGNGFDAYILFVIQTADVKAFSPNAETHQLFAETLKKAESHGVKILAVNCIVTEDEMIIDKNVKVIL